MTIGHDTTFPRNAWYVACTPEELAGQPLGRTICGHPLVIYRDGDGKLAALDDFCPHRGAALSLGSVVDGHLMCGYHGLVMGGDGRVISMPNHERVSHFPRTCTYPVTERHGYVWIWPGDATIADPAIIPDLPWDDTSRWAFCGGLFHVNASFRLTIDNLMDLTHERYVHAGSIGHAMIDQSPVRTVEAGGEVVTSRVMHDIVAPPFWQANMRANKIDDTIRVDRWQISRFRAPSRVLIDVGVAPVGTGATEAPPEMQTSAVVCGFMTPEAASSHWYFWGFARRFALHDEAVTEAIHDAHQNRIVPQDVVVMEAQQRRREAFPDHRTVALDIDAGGQRAQRMLDRLVAAERNVASRGITLNPSGPS